MNLANKFLKSPEFLPLGILLLVGLILRFWNLSITEVAFDNATNSFRAIGWFDFVAGQSQTSPIIWFQVIPWWARLSFSDHPPFGFAIQWLFSVLFGQGSLAMHAAYALAMIISGIILYWLIRPGRRRAAALTLLFFTISSYSLWASRTGYFEALEIIWLMISGFFLLRLAEKNKTADLYWLAISLALALLTKYTALFLLPTAAVYLWFTNRSLVNWQRLWKPALVFLLLLLPVIIYNVMVFRTRGHFDASLSSMLGMRPADYAILNGRTHTSLISNLQAIGTEIVTNNSWPWVGLMVISFIWLLIRMIRKKHSKIELFLVINLGFLLTMFLFLQATARYWLITVPYICLLIGLFVDWLLNSTKARVRVVVLIGLFFLAGFELFYSINTNLIENPIGAVNSTYSVNKFYQRGYWQLDNYLAQQAYGPLPSMRQVSALTSSITTTSLVGRPVILYDERADWSERQWYVLRYQHYYDIPIIYFSELLNSMEESHQPQMVEYVRQAGATGLWVVITQQHSPVDDKGDDYNKLLDQIQASLTSQGIAPKKIITDYRGQEAFRIYYIPLK